VRDMAQESYAREFGRRLKAARKAAGMSRDQLSGVLFVSYSTIESWELGARQPDLYTVCKLARTLDVSVGYLIAGEE